MSTGHCADSLLATAPVGCLCIMSARRCLLPVREAVQQDEMHYYATVEIKSRFL